MPIKQSEVLSRADFDEAVVRLRLNISEISKATGIPRTYLSEFRNGDRRLRPEHLGKLRDFFEERGVKFDSTPDPDAAPKLSSLLAGEAPDREAEAAQSPHPRLRAVERVRCYFPVAD